MFGKYAVIDIIGEGGTGSILLVQHKELETFRAIKLLRKSLITSESFFYEVSILKNLRHPGIPIIYDIEEDDEFYYIVEEYVKGVSLDNYLLEYPKLSYIKKIRLLKQLCEIVNFLHNQSPYPIIHMDIKPQNIKVDAAGQQVYLLDYGNGYIVNNDSQKKYIHGTVGFTNVMQYNNVKSKVVLDMYSLAKVIYFVLENDTDSILVKMLDECINNIESTIKAEDLYLYFKNKEDGLCVSKSICVVGSKGGIGTTHFSLALTTELNRRKRAAVYVNYMEPECVQSILEECKIQISENAIARISNSYCHLLPMYNEENAYGQKEFVRVIDMGVATTEKIQTYSNIIFLCGAREWEKEQTFSLYRELKPMLDNRNVIKIFNCGREMNVPYIENPFKLNFIERKQFEKIIRNIKI